MIQRFFFNDFLRDNQVPELIPVLCACDNIWADEIKKEKHGVTFQRPSLLSLGDDACRLQIERREEGGKSRVNQVFPEVFSSVRARWICRSARRP